MQIQENLIKIFQDTEDHSRNMGNSVTTKHRFNEILMSDVRDTTKGNISVINTDSVSAVIDYSKQGKTCVLNMASYKRPGGGVKRGSRAQEECLFRCSNLTHVVPESFYPLFESQCLYTKDAVFFKDFNYNYMDEVKSDVVTIAAINLNENVLYSPDKNFKQYEDINKLKIRLMLSLAIKNDVDNIILGAFGCGVFNNNPEHISEFFYDILVNESYSKYFENVVFAIINDHNSVSNNFEIFNNKFK